jgi:chromate transporter
MVDGSAQPDPGTGAVREVGALFIKLGTIAFGGPAAHIAMMRREVVERRGWLSDSQFLDLLGATNLIPGPNSTEMAIYIGRSRAGWSGLIVAGVAFILPAMLIVLALAWAYVEYGSTPEADWLLYGIKPVIIAIVIQALFGLGRTAARSAFLAAMGVVVFGLYLLGVNEIALLFGTGLLVMLIVNGRRLGEAQRPAALAAPLVAANLSLPAALASAPASYSATTLFLTFLKIGSVLYGSGYVLLAFLHNDFVVRLGWLTDEQLLDAVAVGQVTPGPVFTTATFIGYVVGGVGGAILATVAIFLPSFVFVAATHPLIPRLRGSPWAGALLDGVNVAAVGLMAAVTVTLAEDAVTDVVTALLALAAAVLLVRFRVNSAWLVLLGGVVGVAYQGLR